VVYLDGGWQALVNALAQRAVSLGVEIQTETSVASLSAVQAHGIIVATDRKTAQQLINVEFPASAPAYVACLDLCLKQLPDDAPTVAFAVDRPLYYSVHSAVAALAPPGTAVVHVMKYLKDTTEEPQAIRRDLEEYAELVMPGWREVLVKDRFLPHLMVSAAIPAVHEHGPDNEPPTIEGVAFAGDWVGSEGMLTDAVVSSALNAAQSLLRACRA
jgi:phytoene dehydrogenase-like protein